MNTGGECSHRLFFALWPDDETRARLAQVARECSPRPVAEEKLHMTLHFLGYCSDELQACYAGAVAAVQCEPFELQLDCLGGRARSGIQWLSASEPPAALNRLVERLAEALAPCGYKPEKRRFLPHVTLSRKVKKPRVRTGLPAITWRVSEFVLAESVQSEGKARYLVRGRWSCE